MFNKGKKNELDIQKINSSVNLLEKILKISYLLIIISAIFVIIKLFQELKLFEVIKVILKTIAPLFIGIFLAWLFTPIVNMLDKKGMRRSIGTAVVYIVFLGIITIILSSMIPVLSEQINDFVSMLPSIFDTIKIWISDFFNNLNNIEGFDANAAKISIFEKIELYGTNLATSLPELMVNIVRSLASGVGTFVVGLIIGFYLLVGFANAGELFVTLFPKKMQGNVRELGNEIENSLRRFINGALIDSFFVFVITSIAFLIVGLKAPLLFGLFCGITNVIPYAGPYIGGVPAVIVGFSQGPITGILTLATIIVIQFLEGNFLQPVIMSKTTKLHPVTIIVGLLIFGHFFGILGMVISTPLIAVIKAILLFFYKKLNIHIFELENE